MENLLRQSQCRLLYPENPGGGNPLPPGVRGNTLYDLTIVFLPGLMPRLLGLLSVAMRCLNIMRSGNTVLDQDIG